MNAGRMILVRHGETEANRLRRFAESDEIPLTDTGRQQSQELASHLVREFHPGLLLSSAYIRARQTSEIIGAALSLTPEVLPGIHERNFGCLRGYEYARMGELMRADSLYDAGRPWLWAPAAGESLDDVRRRAVSSLEMLRSRESHEMILVCHGAVIQSVCAHITGEWRASWVPPNCGYAIIEYDSRGWAQPVICGDWESLSLPS
jgi:broad specificity phosphatase PhoE